MLTPVVLEGNGIACMSYGFVAKRNKEGERTGAFLRGPMASRFVSQVPPRPCLCVHAP